MDPMNTMTVPIEVNAEPWRVEDAPVLLLAGPGTGKTHQLALRLKHLLETKDIAPATITVITFTKEAAENMRARISDEEKPDVYLPLDRRPGRITTMHSLGLEIVRARREWLNLPADFTVMTNSRLRRVLFRDAALLCGRSEGDGGRADRFRQEAAELAPDDIAGAITAKYETILRSCKAIDYDDQISLACEALSGDEAFRNEFAESTTHLLIDEYQDINPSQRQLITMLSDRHRASLFVVGDDDQSIYSFRGGTPKYIRDFLLEFGSNARLLSLVESRRCPDRVIHAALAVVRAFDPGRIDKPPATFRPEKSEAELVQIHDLPSDDEEAAVVAQIIDNAVPRQRALILVPAKQYADKIKRELRRRRISYTHPPNLDDSGFVVLETLYAWMNRPADNFALRQCIECLCESGVLGVPSKRARSEASKAAREAPLKAIATLWEAVTTDRISLWEALTRRANTDTGICAPLHERLQALLSVGQTDIEQFLALAVRDLRPWVGREAFMKEVAIWLDELRSHGQQRESSVRIMTLQAAKGLEAEVVCVIGLNEGVLPRSDRAAEVEEAARLAYVSMSRAKETLHLFHARKRDASITYLQNSFALRPSRFVNAIPREHKNLIYYQSKAQREQRRRREAARNP
jgi:DNA helicase-2/ATP-dependent DNA helicase PcrA